MTADVKTVLWKEWKEILLQSGRRGKWNLLLIIAVFGLFLPWQFGRAWASSPVSLLYWMWVPLLQVTVVIADAFAGERERHTLETLLASRLPDRAILIGKVLAAVSYGWGLPVVSLLAGWAAFALLEGRGALVLRSVDLAASITLISLLCAILMAATGVFVSLRATTVRQAQQTLSLGILTVTFVPILAAQMMPSHAKAEVAQWLANAGPTTILVIVSALLFVADAATLAAAVRRFQRSRLILD